MITALNKSAFKISKDSSFSAKKHTLNLITAICIMQNYWGEIGHVCANSPPPAAVCFCYRPVSGRHRLQNVKRLYLEVTYTCLFATKDSQ
jgi:hypothetical protein